MTATGALPGAGGLADQPTGSGVDGGAVPGPGAGSAVAAIEAMTSQPAWPAGLPEPPAPAPGQTSPAPYLAWLDAAVGVLEARAASNAVELDGLRAQWAHVLSNLDRLRPEEISAVHEGQARMRERIAADAALRDVLLAERERLDAWAEALGGPLTDPTLVRRLLDDAAEERSSATRSVTAKAVDALAGAALDLEVVRRTAERDPVAAAASVEELRVRVVAAAEALRDLGGAPRVVRQHGEPLALALRRCAEHHVARVRARVTWAGGDVTDPDVGDALLAVLSECLAHVASVGGPVITLEAAVDVEPAGSVAMRLSTASEALLPAGDPSWLVRSRARAAVAWGRLLCGRAELGSFVEVRFP